MTTPETINQRKLRQALVDAFNESELQTLCFDLQIDYEALPPGSKLDKTRELVALCLRQQRIEALISLCEQARPKVAWRAMMAAAIASEEPPFMGLKYFDADHADLFFGRETLTAELTDHLQSSNFLAVVGASGSGKSSLVRAGLVPALQKAQPGLKVHIFTPTDHPLEALATTLTRHTDSVGVTAKFMDAMASDARSLHLAARRLVQENEQLLLVIDQFEELFTLCRSEAERLAFVDNLVTAVSNPDNAPNNRPTRAVIALRADFYHHCAQYDALRRLLETQQRFIGAMNPTELRRAIELPARQHGLTFEDGLVDLLLRDVGASGDQPPEPGALPLLSHALLETWRRREGSKLTFSGYSDAGGVQGAIAKTAESVFSQKLTPAQQTIARSIFLRLTELGEGTQDTRRRALISELLPASSAGDETQTVLNLLSAARLISTDEDSAEVTHEALIREWPTLRRWLDENRDGLRLHRHLTESAQAWQQLNRDSGELYRGARLEQAQEWANAHDDELNDLERAFLAASFAAQQQAIADAQAQQQRELAQAQQLATAQTQAARRARNFNIALVTILLLVIGTAAAIVNAQRSQEERDLLVAVTTVTVLEARETAVAADQLAISSTTDAFAAATVNAQATSDIAANATRSAEAAAEATAVFQNQDVDADGLSLTQELALETDPNEADSDSDGLLDGVEVALGTDPNNSDSDFDTIFDGEDNDPLRPYISAIDSVTGEPLSLTLEQVIVLDDMFRDNDDRLPLYGVSMSPDGRRIAAGSYADGANAVIYLWGLDGSMLEPYDIGSPATVWDTAFSNNRVFAAVGSNVQSFSLTGSGSWETLSDSAFGGSLYSIGISPDGTYLLYGGRAVWEFKQIIGNEA
ncbi:MAG: AAA family ATPase, partial [Candidatus Promineifilaceae bacterium]